MLNITETENKIVAIIEAINDGLDAPAFKIVAYPGELEQLGKPIRCATVLIKFKGLNYDSQTTNSFGNCKAVEINTATFEVQVHSHDLRSHRDIYNIAEEVIIALRGQIVGVGPEIQGVSPTYISSFNFMEVFKGGAAYKAAIDVSFKFTDTYLRQVEVEG